VLQAFVFFLGFASLVTLYEASQSMTIFSMGIQPTSELLFLSMCLLALWTGLFHEDGLADWADSLGVPSYGCRADRQPRIRDAMKDSRLGTYGVTALVLLWLGRFAGLTTLDTAAPQGGQGTHVWQWGSAWIVAGVVFWSRLAGLAAASLLLPSSQDRQQPLLARTWTKNALSGSDEASSMGHSISDIRLRNRYVWLLSLGLIGSLAWSPNPKLLALVPFAVVLAIFIQSRAAKRSGQLGGDFVGSSICVTELFFILLLQ
jgi:cobalamin synthase